MNLAWSEFHFLRPAWLCLLLPVAWLGWQWARRAQSLRWWESLCDPALVPHVVAAPGRPPAQRAWTLWLGGLLAVLALAGPTWERVPQPVFRDEAALVILLDLSTSMAATDVPPTRLGRARFRLSDLLRQRAGGQTALIVYAAQAFTVTPLTTDVETLRSQLAALDPDLMPLQGSNPATAVQDGVALLQQAGFKRGDLLLITDGVPESVRNTLLFPLASGDYRLSILGVGTEAGAPVPLPGGGFATRDDGSLVVARLAGETLASLASRGRGIFLPASADGAEIDTFCRFLARQERADDVTATDATSSQWREFGPWLLPPLMLLCLFAFRRGTLLVLCLCPLLGEPAAADWFRTPDQRAAAAYQREQYAAAARQFEDPRWRAAAQYRAGEYAAAAATLDGFEDAVAQYNRGNALAMSGEYAGAVAAYEAALARQSDFPAARTNLERVQNLLEQQQEQQQKKQQPNEEQEDQAREPQDAAGQQGQEGNEGRDGEADEGQAGQAENQQERDAADESDSRQRQAAQRQQARDSASQRGADSGAEDDPQAPEVRPSATDADAGRGDPEQALATEQWLRQIPDDPGGLLRRKFEYQARLRPAPAEESPEPW